MYLAVPDPAALYPILKVFHDHQISYLLLFYEYTNLDILAVVSDIFKASKALVLINFYKYLPVSKEDESWGLCVLNAGCNRIEPGMAYPPSDHPAHHYFSWEKGRVLYNEYQLVYIAKGAGIFEASDGEKITINEGTVFFLFPGEWHRFKPDPQTGWDEYWIGFKGNFFEYITGNNFFSASKPYVRVGIKGDIIDCITNIIEHAKQEKAGYQPVIAGELLHLLGKIHYWEKQKLVSEDNNEIIINKAMLLLRDNINKNISIETVAQQLQVSYSWFRKAFKSYTGIAPGQYLIQLKIERAKTLLNDDTKSVKEIAYELNFESSFYFSRLFKEKTGVTPESFRSNIQL